METIINNKDLLKNKLSTLKGNEKPLFGIMSPQHMIEHLQFSLQFSNGKRTQKLYLEKEKSQKIKAFLLDTDQEIAPGFKSPVMKSDELMNLTHDNMETAVEELLKEIDEYHLYKNQHPNTSPINPVLGALKWAEWDAFHHKHFSHHLRQFALM